MQCDYVHFMKTVDIIGAEIKCKIFLKFLGSRMFK